MGCSDRLPVNAAFGDCGAGRGHHPLRGSDELRAGHVPKVARASQPWVEGAIPLGIWDGRERPQRSTQSQNAPRFWVASQHQFHVLDHSLFGAELGWFVITEPGIPIHKDRPIKLSHRQQYRAQLHCDAKGRSARACFQAKVPLVIKWPVTFLMSFRVYPDAAPLVDGPIGRSNSNGATVDAITALRKRTRFLDAPLSKKVLHFLQESEIPILRKRLLHKKVDRVTHLPMCDRGRGVP